MTDVPVRIRIGDGDLIEVGTVEYPDGVPELLRQVADEMESWRTCTPEETPA